MAFEFHAAAHVQVVHSSLGEDESMWLFSYPEVAQAILSGSDRRSNRRYEKWKGLSDQSF